MLKRGDTFLITQGNYELDIEGFFRAKVDFDPEEVLKEYSRLDDKWSNEDCVDPILYISPVEFLLKNNYLEFVPYRRLHLRVNHKDEIRKSIITILDYIT